MPSTARSQGSLRVAVVGAGSTGLASAALLQQQGHIVTCLVEDDAELAERTAARGHLALSGIRGTATLPLPAVTTDRALVAGADAVLVAAPADRHAAVADELAPWLDATTAVVLMTGYLGGTRLVAGRLARAMPHPSPVYELSSTPALACSWEPARVHVAAVKAWCELTSDHAMDRTEQVARLRTLFPQADPTRHWLASELNNQNPVAHVPAYLCHYARALRGTTAGAFHLVEADDAAVAGLRLGIERERVRVMHAAGLGAHVVDRDVFGLRSYPAGTREPDPPRVGRMFQRRFVTEDVPCGLVPLEALAHAHGVEVPVVSAAVTLASAAEGRDFRSEQHGARTAALLREVDPAPRAARRPAPAGP